MTSVAVDQVRRAVSSTGESSSIECRVAGSVGDIPRADWRLICESPDEALMDPRFLAAVERATSAESRFWYLTFYNAANEPIGAACVSQFLLDGTLFAHPLFRRIVQQVRRVFPRYLNFRVVLCGLGVSTGGSHLRIAPGAAEGPVIAALDRELTRIARQQGAWLIVAKEFDETERPCADHLTQFGFLRTDSLPMNVFCHRCDDYDAFLATVRSHYRYKINRSRKKFSKAGLRVEHVTDPEKMLRLYTPEAHRLYADVVERAEHKLEILPREFFQELVREFGSQVSLTTVHQGERLVAFAWGLKAGEVYRNLFIGLDYSLSEDADVYFNLMVSDLDFALRRHAGQILVGQTADVFKSRLGCQCEPRYVYVRCTVRWLHWCMKAAAKWLFPALPPPPERDLLKPGATDDRAEVAAGS